MLGLVLLTIAAYVGLALVDLPGLWRRRERRAFWVTAALLALGLAVAIPVVVGYRPPSPWKAIEAVFKPLGTVLFGVTEGKQ